MLIAKTRKLLHKSWTRCLHNENCKGGLIMFPSNTTHSHLGRRAFLKATLATAGGMAVANWGGRA